MIESSKQIVFVFLTQIQGGDPTGTGKGGESAWGPTPFADEFKVNLSHTGRGIMLNSSQLLSIQKLNLIKTMVEARKQKVKISSFFIKFLLVICF